MSTVTNFLTPAQRAANLLLETTQANVIHALNKTVTETASSASQKLHWKLDRDPHREHLHEVIDVAISRLQQLKSDLTEAEQFKAKVFTAPQSPEGAA